MIPEDLFPRAHASSLDPVDLCYRYRDRKSETESLVVQPLQV